MIELTNEDVAWSRALAGNEALVGILVRLLGWARVGGTKEEKNEVEKQDEKFNVLCLALGVLTNLVETVPSVKDSLRDTCSSSTSLSPFNVKS